MTASGQRARSGAELLATCEVAGTLTNLAAGAECIAQARVVLTEAARIGDLRDAASGTIAGELRLGVIPTLSPYLLPAVLDVLAERHPGIELVVEESVTESVLEALRTDGIDVGLVDTPTTAPGIVSRTLFREPFTAYVGAGHRLAGITCASTWCTRSCKWCAMSRRRRSRVCRRIAHTPRLPEASPRVRARRQASRTQW